MQEIIDMRGHLTLYLLNPGGAIIQTQSAKNRIVRTGRQLVAQLFAGVAGTPPTRVTHMGVGIDGTPPDDEQKSLIKPRDPRKPISPAIYEDFVDNEGTPNAVKRIRTRLTAEFDFTEANGNEPLREAAIFNEDGVMYNRVIFEPVTKTDAFKLALLWDIIF